MRSKMKKTLNGNTILSQWQKNGREKVRKRKGRRPEIQTPEEPEDEDMDEIVEEYEET